MFYDADVAHVFGSIGGSSKPSSVIVHSAADMLWTDGLDALRHLFSPRQATSSNKMHTSYQLSSLQELAWYCEWKGLQRDATIAAMPCVQVAEILTGLGMPKAEQKAAVQQLTTDDIPVLMQVALKAYLSDAVEIIDSQLPGLNIKQLYERHELFG